MLSELQAQIKLKYSVMSAGELAAELGVSPQTIFYHAGKLNLHKSKEWKSNRGRINARKFDKKLSDEICRLYPDHTTVEIADILGISVYRVRNRASVLRLKKSPEWIRERARKNILLNPEHPGRKTQFKKGHESANKGKKLREYCSLETVEKILQTSFKKNHVPANHKEVGYERVTVDGYVERKTAEPNKFRLLHRIVWEQHNGPIPKGHNIQFKDGNRQNCAIENLYMISRSDQLKKENSFHARYPEEIKMAIHAKAALTRNINRIIKEENHE